MSAAAAVPPARRRHAHLAQGLGILAMATAVAACSSDPPSAPASPGSGRDDAAPIAEADQQAPSTQTAREDSAAPVDAGRSGRDDAAPTAEADQQASSTQPAKEDPAAPVDAGAGRFGIDQDTTIRDVLDALTGAEQACIRGDRDDDVLEAMLDTTVLPEDDDGTGPSILSCLDPDTAREFFLSVAMATMVAAAGQEGLSARTGEDDEACMRDLMAGVDVAALAAEPDGFEEFDVSGLIGASDLSLGLFACIPDLFVASMGDLTPEQESCVRDLMADVVAGDYGSVLASDPELEAMLEFEPGLASLGPLLGLSFDLLTCTPDEFFDDAPPASGDSDDGPDDHAGVLERATPLDVGEVASGKIDHDGHIDYFVFQAEEGMHYQIDVARGTLPYSTATLYDADGFELASGYYYDDELDENIAWESRLSWPAEYTGEHFVAVEGSAGNPGTYTLTVVLDDHADVLDRATSAGVGENVPGAIDVEGDIDFFVFRAEQGMRYRIDVALGTLPGSTASLYGDEPYALTGEYNYTDASRIHWLAEYTGDHYVAVRSPWGTYGGTYTGTYTLTVTLHAFPDDHADVLDRATSVSVGETMPGAIDGDGDIDYFVFQAEQGMHYRIDVALGTLPGSTAALHHRDGYGLAHSDDYGDPDTSRIHWQADYTGDHYVAVQVPRDETGHTGTYTLTVTPVADHADELDRATSVSVGETVPGVIYGEGDIDFFVFQAEQGSRYQIDVALGTLPDLTATLYDADGYGLASSDDYGDPAASRIRWQADYTGDHYVDVQSPRGNTGTDTYTFTVTLDAFPDDHADVLDRATSVSVGGTVPGVIDVEGDIDFFVFQAEQGLHYRIDVALGTLPDSTAALYDDAASMLAYNRGYDAASRIHWQADYTGDHYVDVQGRGRFDPNGTYTLATGTYTLTVVLGHDHADVLERATSVSVGEAVPGVMYGEGDVDFFVFRAEQGTRYEIDVALGTLGDSDATLYDSYGLELAFNEDFDNTGASRIHWQAGYTGDHYIAVRDFYGGGAGTYTLTVTPAAVLDDHADLLHWATSAGVGEAVPGAMDHDGDIDFFVFRAEQGMRYQIDVALGTLTDSVLGRHDAYGRKLAFNDDYGGTAASRIHPQASYNGDHYVAVQGPTGSTGTYTLTIVSTAGHTFNAVTAGSSHSCGLRTDNTVTCWGSNYNAQADPPPGAFNAVTAGSDHSCGLRTDNAITCWGGSDYGQADPLPGTFKAVAAGWGHTWGLRTDNTVTC